MRQKNIEHNKYFNKVTKEKKRDKEKSEENDPRR